MGQSDDARVAAAVATRLGELIGDIDAELRRLPVWRPAPIRRAHLLAMTEVGLVVWRAWRDATREA